MLGSKILKNLVCYDDRVKDVDNNWFCSLVAEKDYYYEIGDRIVFSEFR